VWISAWRSSEVGERSNFLVEVFYKKFALDWFSKFVERVLSDVFHKHVLVDVSQHVAQISHIGVRIENKFDA
jgi:hypothetical protein